jgi:hypothetical protein
MKRDRKFFGIVLAGTVPILLTTIYVISCANAAQVLSWDQFSEGLLTRTSNCGGNSAARSVCINVALESVVIAGDSNDIVDLNRVTPKNQEQLARMTATIWTPDAKYFLRKGQIHCGRGTHEIIVVCDMLYGNVPLPTIWNLHHRNFRHAAGYSDGTAGWLTTAEFGALDKSGVFELKLTPRPDKSGPATFE